MKPYLYKTKPLGSVQDLFTKNKPQLFLLFFVFLLFFTIVGCKNEGGTEKEVTKVSGGKAQVTFVELGSVKCIPCKKMQPIMKEIEKEYGGKVRVVFHDVWTSKGKPYIKKYGIRVIPTQIFLDKNGKEFHRHEGFYPKKDIVELLKTRGL